MSSQSFEYALAQLYTDARARERFLRDPHSALSALELTDAERAALLAIDRSGLVMTAHSLRFKRGRSAGRLERLKRWFGLSI